MTLSEGHEVTTYVSDEDGKRYYMDWDQGKVGSLLLSSSKQLLIQVSVVTYE